MDIDKERVLNLAPAIDGQPDLRVVLCFSFDHRAEVEEVQSFKTCLNECPHVLRSMELFGTFDFIIEAALPDLSAYNDRLHSISKQLQRLVTRYEASFVCKRHQKQKQPAEGEGIYQQEFWVPSEAGFERIDVNDIDLITAERDYARLHLKNRSKLIHATLTSLLEKLDPSCFLRIHRSAIVRRDCIERFIHEGRKWLARLSDGSTHIISKSHVPELLEIMHDSSKAEGPSSKPGISNRTSDAVSRKSNAGMLAK